MAETLPSNVPQLMETTQQAHQESGSQQLAPDLRTKTKYRIGKRPARGDAFYPRKRANTACQVCRARKTKCDNRVPACSYCVSVGATCVQSPTDISSFDPASLKILSRLEDLEQLILRERPEISPRRNELHPSFPDPEPLCLQSHPGDTSEKHSCLVLPQTVKSILSWPIFSSEQIPPPIEHVATPLSQSIRFTSAASSSSSLYDILESNSGKLHRLLDRFFVYVHDQNPILDEASTRRMVRETVSNGIDWSPSSCLTLIICALGCLGTSPDIGGHIKPGHTAYIDSQALFEAAQKRIGALLMKDDLMAAQCLFLSGVYMMQLFQPIHGWRFFLQALAICQCLPSVIEAQQYDIDLDAVSPSSSFEMSNKNSQEQAVYWSAWKSERELRGGLSMPDFAGHDDGTSLYPQFFPTPPMPNDESLTLSDTEKSRSRQAWLFYLADISLRRLTSRVCSAMLTLERSSASNTDFLMALSETIPEYESQVHQWRDSLPEELSFSTSDANDYTINQFVLRGKMMNFFEIICWPFIVGTLSRLLAGLPVPSPILDMASRGFDTHMTQIRVNETGFEYRHHGCFFMIRSCTRSAFILLAGAKVGAQMPQEWRRLALKVTEMLSYWEDEDSEAGAWRILIEKELSFLRQG